METSHDPESYYVSSTNITYSKVIVPNREKNCSHISCIKRYIIHDTKNRFNSWVLPETPRDFF